MSATVPPPLPPLAAAGWWRPIGIGLRWGALVIGIAIALLGDVHEATILTLIGGVALAAVAAWRTVPAMGADALPLASATLVESSVALAVMLSTGGWESPYGVYAVVPVMVASAARGFRFGLLAIVGYAVSLIGLDLVEGEWSGATSVGQLLVITFAGAGAGWVIRRVVLEADEEHDRTLGRVQQLGHVNAMLSTLHDLVRSVPAPLTVEEIVQVIRRQLDELFDADAVALLLNDGGGTRWRPVYAEGIRLPSELGEDALPAPVRAAGPHQRPIIVDRLEPGAGLWEQARSGAYLWLWMRGQPSALLILEHEEPDGTPDDQSDTLERLGVPLALAIDNAVWFNRLRTIGAEEERQRIGAELHDRFAQSLAYIAMTLDLVSDSHPDDEALADLRDDVRDTLSDLRDTLRELRLKVTEERGLDEVLRDHVERIGDRYGLVSRFVVEGDPIRPALPVEQQLLRTVQDLINLAQRESRAATLVVRYTTGPGWLSLAVEDDGLGIPESELGREAVGRLAVVRDRADAIGGVVEVESTRGEGTTVKVTVRGLL